MSPERNSPRHRRMNYVGIGLLFGIITMAATGNPIFFVLGLVFGAYFDKRQKDMGREA